MDKTIKLPLFNFFQFLNLLFLKILLDMSYVTGPSDMRKWKNLKFVIKSFLWFYPPGGKQLGMARPLDASGMFRNLPGGVGGLIAPIFGPRPPKIVRRWFSTENVLILGPEHLWPHQQMQNEYLNEFRKIPKCLKGSNRGIKSQFLINISSCPLLLVESTNESGQGPKIK